VDLQDFVAGLPKAELHVHQEGPVEPADARALPATTARRAPTVLLGRSRSTYLCSRKINDH
jgi:hypothetical protein